MAIYWISFRIADRVADRKSYQQRYAGLESAIKDMSTRYWKETTSFIIFETDTGYRAAAQRFKREISPEFDLFLLRYMENKRAIICGDNDDDTIYDMMLKDDGETYLETLRTSIGTRIILENAITIPMRLNHSHFSIFPQRVSGGRGPPFISHLSINSSYLG